MSRRSAATSTACHALLQGVALARQSGDTSAALRLIDRAYRVYRDARPTLYRAYAELLAADGQDDAATRAMLARAAAQGTDEALESLYLTVLLRGGDLAGARARLDGALARLAVDPSGPLVGAAQALVRQEGAQTPGYIALQRDYTLFGWAPRAQRWDVRVDGVVLHGIRADANGHWRYALGAGAYHGVIEATVAGRTVAGAGARRPAAAGLSAQLTIGKDTAQLHVRCEWDPHYRPQLLVRCGPRRLRLHATAGTAGAATPPGDWPLTYRLRRTDLPDDAPWALSLRSPAGVPWCPADSPLLWPRAARQARGRARGRAPRRIPVVAPCAVVIPVYAGYDETLSCLRAVQQTRPLGTRVLVIDDAAPDPALVDALQRLAASGAIELLRHPRNRGFAAAVNTGLAACAGHDVVLLNADTVVHGDWLARLRRAAYARAQTGTVTPWSGDGSVVSYPLQSAETPPLRGAALDALVAHECAGETPPLPVGVGFCLYLRHDCWTQVGVFADAVFGRGYGEETDYCLRARAAGFHSVLAADVYVEHLGGRSFGADRQALWLRAQRLVQLRHPGYAKAVARYGQRDPLHALRRRLDAARLRASTAPAVLIVSLALGGGVGRAVAARQTALLAAGHTVLVLAPDGVAERVRMRLTSAQFGVHDLVYDTRREQPLLLTLLRDLPLVQIELHHILNIPLALIDALYTLGVAVDVQLHDYVYVCPQVTLMGRAQQYCGEAPLRECVRCVRAQGSSFGEGLGAAALRRRSTPWLRQARRVQAPSADTAERYQRYFPGLAVHVAPHAPVVARLPVVVAPMARARTRVALLGAIGDHKGYRVLLACARYARAQDLPLEFVVVGYTHDDAALLQTGRVFITGPYADEELVPLLQRERPDVLFLASVWPETWSYTLDAALVTDLPIVAFDIGAISRRLSQSKRGNLLPLRTPINALCAQLQTAREPRVTNALGLASQGVNMADVDPNALTATVQVLPLPAGVYLFSVQAGAHSGAAHASGLQLPALQVSTGPGVAASDVEIMGRGGDRLGWLVRSGDFIVLRLHAAQTPVLVTSVQDSAGNALTVRAERLDTRFEETVTAPVTAPVAEAAVGLPLQIAAHVRNRGDLQFVRTAWAGRVDKGLWIESFSIRPLDGLAANELEYKSLTSSGFETPWISEDKLCGTQGMGVPLIGFAVRLKPSARSSAYDVEYSGAFASGAIVGPLKNGVPCRSTVGNDPLEGLQVQIIPRRGAHRAAKPAPVLRVPAASRAASKATVTPKTTQTKSKPAAAATVKAKAPATAKAPAKAKPQAPPAKAKAGRKTQAKDAAPAPAPAQRAAKAPTPRAGKAKTAARTAPVAVRQDAP